MSGGDELGGLCWGTGKDLGGGARVGGSCQEVRNYVTRVRGLCPRGEGLGSSCRELRN